jgi:dihydrofolate reductase
MKLTTVTILSVDGVMQGLGGPDEDRSGGFERGGRAGPQFDSEAMAFLYRVYQRADAFLFGRRTYEIFAGYRGAMGDSGHPIPGALNTQPKYVASTTLTEPRWANTTVLPGDVAAAPQGSPCGASRGRSPEGSGVGLGLQRPAGH